MLFVYVELCCCNILRTLIRRWSAPTHVASNWFMVILFSCQLSTRWWKWLLDLLLVVQRVVGPSTKISNRLFDARLSTMRTTNQIDQSMNCDQLIWIQRQSTNKLSDFWFHHIISFIIIRNKTNNISFIKPLLSSNLRILLTWLHRPQHFSACIVFWGPWNYKFTVKRIRIQDNIDVNFWPKRFNSKSMKLARIN